MIAQNIHEIMQVDPSTPMSTIVAHMKSILRLLIRRHD